MSVAEPQKELRFTRAGQAVPAAILGAVCAIAALIFVTVGIYRSSNPDLPHPAWGLIPLALALGFFRLAWHCARHAYILLSPIGVEIFPFFRPGANMQVIPWAGIVAAEVDDGRLTLHFNPEKTSGIHLSLAPISKDRRELLAKAIRGRLPSA
jgi:hypothetical protein